MDTDQGTLEWIQKGVIAATVAQKPYSMALIGTKMLDDLHHHPISRLAANWTEDPFAHVARSLDTGVTLIDKNSVELFRKPGTARHRANDCGERLIRSPTPRAIAVRSSFPFRSEGSLE